jgi:hypothetical protein
MNASVKRSARDAARRLFIGPAFAVALIALVAQSRAQTATPAPANAAPPPTQAPLVLERPETPEAEDLGDLPAPSSEPRNFEGIWKPDFMPPLVQSALGTTGALVTIEGSVPPYSVEGANIFWHRVLMEQRGTPVANSASLYRPGIPLSALNLYLSPMSVVQTERELVILFEAGPKWHIRLDRGHPSRLAPTYGGDSVGHWEGATLVVDSTGFNTKTWLDSVGSPHSTELRFITRISKLPQSRKLEFLTTFEDPKMYTRPFTIRSTASWTPELRMLEVEIENTRSENNEQLVIEN